MQLTTHFNSDEFKCKCGCEGLIIDARLVLSLESLRGYMESPIEVLSGFRCPKHNKAVGGARSSKHLLGIAADVTSPDLMKLYKAASKYVQFNGIGLDTQRNFLHVDVRNAPKVQWSYKDGREVPFIDSEEEITEVPKLRAHNA